MLKRRVEIPIYLKPRPWEPVKMETLLFWKLSKSFPIKVGIESSLYLQSHTWVVCIQFSSVQSLSRVRLFATPWITARQAPMQSMGSLRVGHDWLTLLSLFTFMYWRRKWQPTPVFLPGEFQGQTLLCWAPKSLQMVSVAMKLKDACSLEEKLWPHYRAY